MKAVQKLLCVVLLLAVNQFMQLSVSGQDVKEATFEGPNNLRIKVRMEGPYTADVPLQIVCYFKYTPEGAKRMTGAPVELDKELGGVIASLRERGEFAGEELETLYITPPKNSIKARGLLLVGLGNEESLSLKVLERVGRTSLRAASAAGVKRAAFAPLIRDQGNTKLSAGDVAFAIIRAMLIAHDTEVRLEKEGLAKPIILEEWIVEAGPAYFDETTAAVDRAIQQATSVVKERRTERYSRAK